MEAHDDTSPQPSSLVGIRVAAAVGAVVAVVAVVVGFSVGAVYGVVALVALPAIPLAFVLAFESIRGTS